MKRVSINSHIYALYTRSYIYHLIYKEKFFMQLTKTSAFGLIPTVLAVLTVVLSACMASSPTTTDANRAPANQQILNQPLAGISDIETFDPAMVATTTSLTPVSMVFTGLVSLDANQKVVPELAQSWSTSSNGLVWTFTLKPNLKFSDGTPLTSAAVVYSLNRALQPDLGSPAAPSYLNLIQDSNLLLTGKITTLIGDSLLAPEPNTVVIKINQPVSYFLATLTYPTAFVVEEKLIDKYGNINFTDHLNEGGGSGPFKVKSYTHDKDIVLVPNPYYIKAKPTISVNLIFYPDANTAYEAYRNGQLDIATIPSSFLSQVQNTNEYHKTPTLAIFYYALNFLAKPFDNIKIRQAFDLALDKSQIVSIVYKNVVVPTNHIIPSGMPGYNPNLKGPDGTTSTSGNPTLAKKLFAEGLQEEGYSSVSALPKMQFDYASGNADTDREIAIAVNEWQEVLGVKIQTVPTDFGTLTSEEPKTVGNSSLQMFQTGWSADYPDAQDFTTLQFSKGSPNNSTNYGQNNTAVTAQQVQVQKELSTANVETNPTTRNTLYANAEQQLVNVVAWLPMYQGATSYALKTYVHGYTFDATDLIPPFDWANVYIIKH
jgi:peptide/nickel transport system substrate-binding protein/oligopeptide transport system substrate-binding protein